MCKTRFDSQGMILNVFFYKKKHFWKKNLMERVTPTPFMANTIKNLHIFLTFPYVCVNGTCWLI